LQDMKGYRVVDEAFGPVGTLERLLELSGNPQLEISHNNKLVLIPLQDEFIRAIDHESKEIRVEAPPGLIELYLS
ncbi:MAG: 16S rRNA processing protein RimM, partial [Flavobacteriales bacterium]